MGSLFHMLICHLCIFGQVSVEVFVHFLIELSVILLSFEGSLYILDTMYLLQVFPPSLWLVF